MKELSTAQRLWYAFVRLVIIGFCKAFWRMTVEGTEHVPATGAFILAPVHRSNIDTPIVCAVTRRHLRYMGKQEMWKYRFSAWFFTSLGGFPVHRGTADREALRRCTQMLERGEALVMFPEGTRQSGPSVGELFDGAAYLALRTGAPIVPLGIGGSEAAMPKGARMIRPVRLALVVGEPLVPRREEGTSSRRATRELTERLTGSIQELFDRAEAAAGVVRRD